MTFLAPRKREQMTVQHIGDETLVYDEQRHQAFCLNATAAAVWNLADGSRGVEQLALAASLQLGQPVPEPVVALALAQLERDGLLEPAAPAAPVFAMPTPVSRRAVLGSLGATSLVLLPAVASLMTPKAAQAYSGCFDCSNTAKAPGSAAAAAQRRRESQAAAASEAAAARKQQNAGKAAQE